VIRIRPVSDLRNKFPEIERVVNDGEAVFLTKNGYGAMVVMSLEKYAQLTENLKLKLKKADRAAAASAERHNHKTVFSRLKKGLHAKAR